jgi:hypothetical protein
MHANIDANDSNLRAGDGARQAAHEAPGAGRQTGESTAGSGGGTGRQTTVLLNNETGRLYQAEYRLRELADVQTSRICLSFGPNEKYGLTNDRDHNQPENQAKVFNGATRARFKPERLINKATANQGPWWWTATLGGKLARHDIAAGVHEQPRGRTGV